MIDLLFALLNTGVLFLLLGYIYRRFMHDRIQHGMLFEHATHLNLVKRQEALRKQEQGLVRAYYHQHYRYEELSKKIELWRQQLVLKEQREQLYQEDAAAAIQKLYHAREHYIQDRRMCTAMIEKTVALAHRDLKTYFADPARGEAYISTVIAAQSAQRGPHGSR